MAKAFIVILIGLPIVELLVLYKVGSVIGVLPLLALLAGTTIAGCLLLRHQGMTVVRRAFEQLARDEAPVQSVVDAIGLTFAGVLFVLPGLLSDVAALLLLIPPVRRWLVTGLLLRTAFGWTMRDGRPDGQPGGRTGDRTAGGGPAGDGAPAGGRVIDGEFERLGERTIRPGPQDHPGQTDPHRPDGADPRRHDRKPGSPWRS